MRRNQISQRAKCRFHFRQLHVLLPEICSTVYCQIRAQQIGASIQHLQPLPLRNLRPRKTALDYPADFSFAAFPYAAFRYFCDLEPSNFLAAFFI
jgi:hypothetical protein